MVYLEQDPAVLEEKVGALWQRRQEDALDAESLEGLAEGCFRLAVHADTSVGEAVRLLRRSCRLDAINPKYPYHLSRLYFRCGKLEQARDWIARACRLCPTSHRIWSHVYLLQSELHSEYAEDLERERYDLEAIASRLEQIADAVCEGQDDIAMELADFTVPNSRAYLEKQARAGSPVDAGPEPGPASAGEPSGDATRARRIVDAETCRWSGIYDLLLERGLLAPARQRQVGRLSGLLEKVAVQAARRPGGSSAFTVLAVQWILRGYPVATVRRLRATTPSAVAAGSPSEAALETICDLYETPPAELPERLREILVKKRLPASIVAAVHWHRIIPRTLHFPAPRLLLSAGRLYARCRRERPTDARQAQERIDRAGETATKIYRALASMEAPPPAPLTDVEQQPSSSQASPEQVERQLEELESLALGLESLRDELLAFIREHIGPASKLDLAEPAYLRGAVDHALASELIGELKAAGQLGLARLERSVEQLARFDKEELSGDCESRRHRCDTALKSAVTLGALRRHLKRSAGGFTEITVTTVEEQPSPQLVAISQRLRAAAPEAGDDDPPARPAPPSSPPPEEGAAGAGTQVAKSVVGIGTLGQALRDARLRIDRHFRDAIATFEHYPAWACRLPELQAILLSLRAHQAETLSRLGRWADARRAWARMLSADPLDRHVLMNIATCETTALRSWRALRAWETYLECLYFFDLILRGSRRFGLERAIFHRAYGGAYGTAYLNAEKADEKILLADGEAISDFLSNTARVRCFVQHKQLEFLDSQLSARSPLVRLGSTRDDSLEERTRAVETLLSFVRSCKPLFPARLGLAFTEQIAGRIETAAESCQKTERVLARNDPHYEEDRELHLKLLAGFADLKIRFYYMVTELPRLPAELRAVGFLSEISGLDDIPLMVSRGFGRPVAQAYRIEPEELARFVGSHVVAALVSRIMSYLLRAEATEDAQSDRTRQYQRLVEEWVTEPALDEYLPLIDSPGRFYPPAIQELHQQLAEQTSQKDSDRLADQLIQHLELLCDRYVSLSGIARDLAQFLELRGRRDEAIRVLDRAARHGFHEEGRDACRQHRANLQTHRALKNEDYPTAIPPALELLAMDDRRLHLVEHVTQLYVAAANATGEDPGYEHMRQEIGSWAERARKALAEFEPSEESPDPPITETEIVKAERTRDEAVIEIHYILMFASFKKGVSQWNAGQKSEARSYLDEARTHAEYFILHAADQPDKINKAEEILTELGRLT